MRTPSRLDIKRWIVKEIKEILLACIFAIGIAYIASLIVDAIVGGAR